MRNGLYQIIILPYKPEEKDPDVGAGDGRLFKLVIMLGAAVVTVMITGSKIYKKAVKNSN